MPRGSNRRHLILVKEDIDTLIARLRFLLAGLEEARMSAAGIEIESSARDNFYVPRVVRIFERDQEEAHE